MFIIPGQLFYIQRDLCELQEKPNFLDDIIYKLAFMKDMRINMVYKKYNKIEISLFSIV